MLSVVLIALMAASFSEPAEAQLVHRLYGAPSAEARSVAVTCDDTTYSFDYRREGLDHSFEFSRTPVVAPKALSETMLGILAKFFDLPDIKAWCSSSDQQPGVGVVMFEMSGNVDADDRGARADCSKREGKYDPESLWLVDIEGDAVTLSRGEIGKCTTKEDIDDFNHLTGGAVK